jgi:hypothetical protein
LPQTWPTGFDRSVTGCPDWHILNNALSYSRESCDQIDKKRNSCKLPSASRILGTEQKSWSQVEMLRPEHDQEAEFIASTQQFFFQNLDKKFLSRTRSPHIRQGQVNMTKYTRYLLE